mgnify:FL=1
MKNLKKYHKLFHEVVKEHQEGGPSDINSRILILDGLNTFIRVFSAVPALNDDGDHIGGVTGFLRSIAANIRLLKPTRVIICFDGKGGSKRRKKIYPDYKANRAVSTKFNRYQEFASKKDESESMKKQFGRLIEYLNCLPITMLAVDNIEADDTIAYIANEVYTEPNQKVQIVSTDRDFLQLVNNRISVWSPIKKKMYTPELMREEFGINASNYLLYRTFLGDKSDNIPGVKGVALKSLIKYFPMVAEDRQINFKELLEHAQDGKDRYKIYKSVIESEDQVDLNRSLMQLKEVDIAGSLKMMIHDKVTGPVDKLNTFQFKKMFMQDKMYTVIKDLDSWLATSFNTLNAYRSL